MEKAWEFKERQYYRACGKKYDIHAAIRYAAELTPFEIDLKTLYLDYASPCNNNLKDFARHVKQTLDADLSKPIILNEDGVIIDGKHRLTKAFLHNRTGILAVKFDKDPEDIYQWEN